MPRSAASFSTVDLHKQFIHNFRSRGHRLQQDLPAVTSGVKSAESDPQHSLRGVSPSPIDKVSKESCSFSIFKRTSNQDWVTCRWVAGNLDMCGSKVCPFRISHYPPDRCRCVLGFSAKRFHILTAFSQVMLDARSRIGVTPLMRASSDGYRGVVELLLEAGADVDAAWGDGTTSLWSASESGHAEVVSLLLAAGADTDVTVTIGARQFTALQIAREKGHADIVRLLEE